MDEPTIEDLHFGHLDKQQLINEEWAKGKRIDPVKGISLNHWTGQGVIHFDDGKFLVIEIDTDYDDQQITARMIRPHSSDLRYLDLVTDEEWETYRADKKSRETVTADESRRILYERLKAEFEGDD